MPEESKEAAASRSSLPGTLLILLAGCCWGSIGIFVRQFAKQNVGSIELVVIRSVFTAALMLVFLLFYDRSMLKIRLRDVWCFLGTGICSMALFNFCYFRLITVTSLSTAAVMLYTAPVFVMLLAAPLFRERITPVKLAALLMTVVGCAFVTGFIGSGDRLTVKALLLGIGAGAGYALYSVFCRFAMLRGYHNFTIIFYTFLFTSAAMLPFADTGAVGRAVFGSAGGFFFSALCGIVTTVLPYLVYNFGLRRIETGKAAIIASVEPVVATLVGAAVFSETLGAGNIVGIALVLGAVVLCNIKTGNKKNTKSQQS